MEDALPAGFTACALLYGDYPRLARRCLGSIVHRLDPALVPDLRVLLNAVSPAARDAAVEILRGVPADTRVLVYDSPVNRLKYPMMRKALYDQARPVVTPYFAWFDDDSCLAPESSAAWWSDLHHAMQAADLVGKLYRLDVRAGQAGAIVRQPWFAGKAVGAGHRYLFPTGGFWCARASILYRWDYPFLDIEHNGGDAVLGELCRQQGYRVADFSRGVWVNADETGAPSRAPRRGESHRPVWASNPHTAGGPHYPADHAHHAFEVEPFDPRD